MRQRQCGDMSESDSTSTGSPSAQPATAFAALGGEGAVRRLVDRFYDLMELEPHYAVIRRLHPTPMDGSRDKLFWFLCGWLGGPPYFEQRFGHPRLRARHLPFAIGIAERDAWMSCMRQAMNEEGVEPGLAQRLDEAFFNTADWMRNRGG
jgi:hemoglobin